jgi:inner membrane transporter RhtA
VARLTRVPAVVLVLAAIISLQFGAGIARTQFEVVGPLGATFLRLAFAALILLAVLRPRVRTWPARSWFAAGVLGIALAGMNTMIYLAFDHVPLGVAVTIEFLGPLVLALAQTRRIVDALWAVLALAGVLLLGLDGGGSIEVVGLIFAGCAGAFWACYILATAQVGRWMLLIFLAVAVLSSALPYALDLIALRRVPTRVFGVLSSLGPAVAALAGLVILHEALGWSEAIALICVTVASIGVTLARGRGTGYQPRRERIPATGTD